MNNLISLLLLQLLLVVGVTQYYQNRFDTTTVKWMKLELEEVQNKNIMCKFKRRNK